MPGQDGGLYLACGPVVLNWTGDDLAPHLSISGGQSGHHTGVCVLVAQLCPTICNSMDYTLPGSSVHGILQARILEWVAIPFSQRSSLPRNRTLVSCIANRFFTCEQPGKPIVGGGGILLSSRSIWAFHDTTAAAAAANALQSCPTLCDPIDGSPLGSPVSGILQARTLEWVAISFSNA